MERSGAEDPVGEDEAGVEEQEHTLLSTTVGAFGIKRIEYRLLTDYEATSLLGENPSSRHHLYRRKLHRLWPGLDKLRLNYISSNRIIVHGKAIDATSLQFGIGGVFGI